MITDKDFEWADFCVSLIEEYIKPSDIINAKKDVQRKFKKMKLS